MKGIYLLLGSNLGDREEMLDTARRLIKKWIGPIVNCSFIYETEAWGIEDQPDFLNQALEIETKLKPGEVLDLISKIEKEMGRKRYQKWGTRIIDIDILYFSDKVIDTEQLKIPHPGNPKRKFVLIPMVEIAPGLIHPSLSLTQEELLKRCQDPLLVKLFK